MTNKMFLAIGGPKSFTWLADMGQRINVLLPSQFKFNATEVLVTDVPDVMDIKSGVYRLEKIGYYDNYKQIYVYEDITNGQAFRLLSDYLLEQFILMEDPTT